MINAQLTGKGATYKRMKGRWEAFPRCLHQWKQKGKINRISHHCFCRSRIFANRSHHSLRKQIQSPHFALISFVQPIELRSRELNCLKLSNWLSPESRLGEIWHEIFRVAASGKNVEDFKFSGFREFTTNSNLTKHDRVDPSRLTCILIIYLHVRCFACWERIIK